MIAKLPQPAGKPLAVGGHHATFAAGNVLYRMKTEDAHVADATHAPLAVSGSQRMAGVFDHRDSLAGKLQNFIECRRMAGEIHRQNGLGLRRDASPDCLRIKIERVVRDVGKHRLRALIHHRIRGGAESQRRGNGFVTRFQIRRECCPVQRRGSTAESNRVPRIHQLRDRILELLDFRSGG